MKYNTPECEVLEFKKDDILTLSFDSPFVGLNGANGTQSADVEESDGNGWY